jgi:hypothetical protein
MPRIFKIRFAIILLMAIPAVASRAQHAEFHTTYTGAIIATPINTSILFTPHQDFQPVLSGSIEYSFPKTGRLGFELSGGYYPYGDRSEATVQFGIRRFFAAATPDRAAPVGAYWEMLMMGGVSGAELSTADPLLGLGLRFGSLRTSRFGDLAYEYGAGPTVVLLSGQTQVRATFFFGLGLMLGHNQIIE